MRPWSEVNAALRTLWFQYWQLKFQYPHGRKRYGESIQLLTNEIVLRDQRIRELEQQLSEARKTS